MRDKTKGYMLYLSTAMHRYTSSHSGDLIVYIAFTADGKLHQRQKHTSAAPVQTNSGVVPGASTIQTNGHFLKRPIGVALTADVLRCGFT